MKTKMGIALVALVLSTGAHAGMWGSWIAGGTACNNYNVGVVDNGGTLSVLFDAFSVNMPEREVGDGTSVRKSCTFRIAITPPNGFYLAGFRQLYSGGLIKSSGSSAQLNIRYNIGSVTGMPLPIVFSTGRTLRPEDPSSLFQREYQNDLLVANCGGSTVYGLNMSFTATRRSLYEHIVGGLDSVDADFTQEMVLIPEFRLCRR